MNIALLIIDVQKAFLAVRKNTKEYNDTLAYINATSTVLRKAGMPVFIIRNVSEGNDESFNVPDELKVCDKDIDLIKHYSNSFWKTDLEEQLRKRNVDFVVVCGTAAEHCVLSTYNGARERGFRGAILQNGVFADSPNGLLDLFYNRPLISYSVISYMFEKDI
ncbi:MAG: isochorismatase [Tenericutes bacterium HGW-Tenericutes-2]|jgi:nicotinamidase-related amidase|nr:MAG: isochorismatase [Tenericutes bacterium HGW-Tenericutes-2]